MWRLLRLQLVFWLGALLGVVALLIAVIAGDLRDVPLRALAITSLFLLALCGLCGINSRCVGATVSSFSSISFPLMSTSFLFLPGLLLGLLGDL